MRALVVYATTEGHTAKIAEWVGDWFHARSYAVVVLNSADVADQTLPDGFDAYVLTGSVHVGKHQKSLIQFVQRNLRHLNNSASAFISASASAGGQDAVNQGNAKACIQTFLSETGWKPTATMPIGGAILYTKYNFFLRMVMKRISKKEGGPTDTSRDHELTDWAALDAFLTRFVAENVESSFDGLTDCAVVQTGG